MILIEILVALAAISFVIFIFSRQIINALHGKHEECDTCKKRMSKSLDKIRKELNKECTCKNKA